jgi:hypothetical protein
VHSKRLLATAKYIDLNILPSPLAFALQCIIAYLQIAQDSNDFWLSDYGFSGRYTTCNQWLLVYK